MGFLTSMPYSTAEPRMLERTSLILSLDGWDKLVAAKPEKIPLNAECGQIAQAELPERREEVVPDDARVAVLRASGHQRHDHRDIGFVHIGCKIRCGPDALQALVERPKHSSLRATSRPGDRTSVGEGRGEIGLRFRPDSSLNDDQLQKNRRCSTGVGTKQPKRHIAAHPT
jgi:hypothetical protein